MWRSKMALVAEIHRDKLSASISSVIVWSDQPIERASLPAYGRLEDQVKKYERPLASPTLTFWVSQKPF